MSRMTFEDALETAAPRLAAWDRYAAHSSVVHIVAFGEDGRRATILATEREANRHALRPRLVDAGIPEGASYRTCDWVWLIVDQRVAIWELDGDLALECAGTSIHLRGASVEKSEIREVLSFYDDTDYGYRGVKLVLAGGETLVVADERDRAAEIPGYGWDNLIVDGGWISHLGRELAAALRVPHRDELFDTVRRPPPLPDPSAAPPDDWRSKVDMSHAQIRDLVNACGRPILARMFSDAELERAKAERRALKVERWSSMGDGQASFSFLEPDSRWTPDIVFEVPIADEIRSAYGITERWEYASEVYAAFGFRDDDFAAADAAQKRRWAAAAGEGPRVRTTSEMLFYASLQTCPQCGARIDPDGFRRYGQYVAWVLVGTCAQCGNSVRYDFRTFGDPAEGASQWNDLGNGASEIISPRLFIDEIERLSPTIDTEPSRLDPAAWTTNRDANHRVHVALTELAKFLPVGGDSIPDAALSPDDRVDKAARPDRYSRIWIEALAARHQSVIDATIADLPRISKLEAAVRPRRRGK